MSMGSSAVGSVMAGQAGMRTLTRSLARTEGAWKIGVKLRLEVRFASDRGGFSLHLGGPLRLPGKGTLQAGTMIRQEEPPHDQGNHPGPAGF
jgi:hypothetical protein